jgi:hypothetical protein
MTSRLAARFGQAEQMLKRQIRQQVRGRRL